MDRINSNISEEELGYMRVFLENESVLRGLMEYVSFGKEMEDVAVVGIEKDKNLGVCATISYREKGEKEVSVCKLSNFIGLSFVNVGGKPEFVYDSTFNGKFNEFMQQVFGRQYREDVKAFRDANKKYISALIDNARAHENLNSNGDPAIEPEDAV